MFDSSNLLVISVAEVSLIGTPLINIYFIYVFVQTAIVNLRSEKISTYYIFFSLYFKIQFRNEIFYIFNGYFPSDDFKQNG